MFKAAEHRLEEVKRAAEQAFERFYDDQVSLDNSLNDIQNLIDAGKYQEAKAEIHKIRVFIGVGV